VKRFGIYLIRVFVEVFIYVAMVTLALVAWYCGFSHYNRKRSREVLTWIEAAFAGHGSLAGVHWRSPGRFLAHLKLRPNSCFQQAAIEVALAQREIPHRWLKARIKRIPESLTFEADLEFAPLYVLEVHHQRWCGRTRRKLPDNPETWPTQHVTPLVITTRSDWQREITMMMSSLEASRESEILNVSFRRSSPHFIVTIALSAIAPNAGGTELFTVLQELAGSASASRF
jgi:hypothetical protein